MDVIVTLANGDAILAKTEASKLEPLIDVGKEGFAKLIQGPQSLVWIAIFQQDQAKLDLALLAGLQAHKEFWGNSTNSQKEYGWLSFPCSPHAPTPTTTAWTSTSKAITSRGGS